MSYEKQTWQTGDTVTSAKLNHMEDGIASAGGGGTGGGVLIVGINMQTMTLDKTWQEIHDADMAFLKVVRSDTTVSWMPVLTVLVDATCEVTFLATNPDDGTSIIMLFSSASADEYPVYVS